jgi:hypothetical protein
VGIAIVYIAFASCTLTFAWFAVRQPVDLVSDDYYAQAMDHDARQAAALRGQLVALDLDLAADRRELTLTWIRPETRPAAGTTTFYRASNPAWDRRVPLAVDQAGRQRISLAGMAAGHWRVRLQWTAEGRDHYTERVIVMP